VIVTFLGNSQTIGQSRLNTENAGERNLVGQRANFNSKSDFIW